MSRNPYEELASGNKRRLRYAAQHFQQIVLDNKLSVGNFSKVYQKFLDMSATEDDLAIFIQDHLKIMEYLYKRLFWVRMEPHWNHQEQEKIVLNLQVQLELLRSGHFQLHSAYNIRWNSRSIYYGGQGPYGSMPLGTR